MCMLLVFIIHYPLICHDLPLTQTFFDYHDLPLTQLPFLITIDYSLDYNLNLVNNYCSWPNIGQVPTPQGTDLYLLFFFLGGSMAEWSAH